MLRFVLLIVVLTFSQLTFAQVRATTESGNKVLLFDNGTWRYEEKSVSTATTEVQVAPVVVPVVNATVEVDATKEIALPFTTFFYMPSKRLVRYFGEEKGQIRCKLSCENSKGMVTVKYSWEIPVGDAVRYYGFLKAGKKLTFYLQNGEEVELAVGENSTVKARAEYNFTSISGTTVALNETQMAALIASPVRKMEVEWKKTNEAYELDYSPYFVENLPQVF